MSITLKAILPVIGMMAMLCAPQGALSQIRNNSLYDTINQDDMGDVSDEFQELFFRALGQGAIENHEKAIDLLNKAGDKSPDKAVVNYELGKNYLALKRYQTAGNYLEKALKTAPDNTAIRHTLYTVYDRSKQYDQAIGVAKSLAKNDPAFFEKLAQLYQLTNQPLKGLRALDKIDNKRGRNRFRRNLRRKILRESDTPEALIGYLKKQISTSPDITDNYLDLIVLYNRLNRSKKAYKIARDLHRKNPDLKAYNLGTYTYYLSQNSFEKAVESMKILLQNDALDNDIKKQIIKHFTTLVKNHPEYEDDLIWALGEESSGGHQSNQQKGEYYLGKDNAKALSYFEKALAETPTNFKLIKQTLTLQLKENRYKDARQRSEQSLAVFPSQPFLYFAKGMAENNLKKYNQAKKSLQNGLDFVAGNTSLKIKFYRELSTTFKKLGDDQKAEKFKHKADRSNAKD